MPVLLAGDEFVLYRLIAEELAAVAGAEAWALRELDLPWPDEPMGRVAEVDEASGTEDQMIEALRGAAVCVTHLAPLTEKILDASPDLRLFCISRGGPVNANLEAATARGVAVTFAPGRNATATAEHTVAMMLAATRAHPAHPRRPRRRHLARRLLPLRPGGPRAGGQHRRAGRLRARSAAASHGCSPASARTSSSSTPTSRPRPSARA